MTLKSRAALRNVRKKRQMNERGQLIKYACDRPLPNSKLCL